MIKTVDHHFHSSNLNFLDASHSCFVDLIFIRILGLFQDWVVHFISNQASAQISVIFFLLSLSLCADISADCTFCCVYVIAHQVQLVWICLYIEPFDLLHELKHILSYFISRLNGHTSLHTFDFSDFYLSWHCSISLTSCCYFTKNIFILLCCVILWQPIFFYL